MYALTGPGGIREICATMDQVREYLQRYPYIKFRRFNTEAECVSFLHQYHNNNDVQYVTNYGNTFSNLYVRMEYFISDVLYLNYDISNFGSIYVSRTDVEVINRPQSIHVKVPDLHLSRSIHSNVVAIYHGLSIIGDNVDVSVEVPDSGTFYAIYAYSGTNKTILSVRDYIQHRKGKVGVTIRAS